MPAYTIFTVSAKGIEQKTGQTIHLPTDAFVSALTPAAIDFSSAPGTSQTLTITGYHLGSIDTVVFTDHANSKSTVPIQIALDATKSDTQLLVTLDPSKLAILGATKITVDVTFLANKKPITPNPAESLTFTGPKTTPAKSPPAKNPPAKNPPAKNAPTKSPT
jgi:hypothetical protein